MFRNSLLALLCCGVIAAIWVVVGLWTSDAVLWERANIGDTAAMISLADKYAARGNPMASAQWLRYAAGGGDAAAVSLLEARAASGEMYSMVFLAEHYDEEGRGPEANDLLYRVARLAPDLAAMPAAVRYIFGESGERDVLRGIECLVMQARHQDPCVYIFLCRLVDDGVVPAPPDAELAHWRSEAAKSMAAGGDQLLCVFLEGFEEEGMRAYQKVWPRSE